MSNKSSGHILRELAEWYRAEAARERKATGLLAQASACAWDKAADKAEIVALTLGTQTIGDQT